MKRLLLLLFAWTCSLTLSAQVVTPEVPSGKVGQRPTSDSSAPVTEVPGITAAKGNARIKGIVVDSTTGRPVQFATIALLHKISNKPIDGVITDEQGTFVVSRVGAGEYNISITFIGFQAKIIPGIQVLPKDNLQLGKILIQPDVTQLAEITVTGEKSLIEDKIDRIVYNAEKDITNAGGDASDVLKKVPMLLVDIEGNVELRGNANVEVLINGKPSSVMATNVADALRQIPADIIKRVEVITSPSAKYDAEGTAGIINIITKKNNLQGVNGSVYTAAGNRSGNSGVNLNFRRSRFGATIGAGGNYSNSPSNGYLNRASFSGKDTTYLNQNTEFRGRGGGGYGQVGLDYDIDEKNTLNAELRLNQFGFSSSNVLGAAFTDERGKLIQSYRRNIRNQNHSESLDGNVSYTRTFNESGQELTVLAQRNVNQPGNESFTEQIGLVNVVDQREQNRNNSYNAETTLQTDYVHPFKNKTTVEVGGKAAFRRVSSNYAFSVFDTEQRKFIINADRSNVFNYNQDVLSGYVTYAFGWKKLSFKLGSRYEQTYIKAHFESSGTSFAQPYVNFIPSATIFRELKQNQKLRFSYTQRMQRPQIVYLNPYINDTDPKNIFYGNPNLDPELAHSFELGYSTYVEHHSLNASLYWRQTNNAIESVRAVDQSGVSRTTYQNIAGNGAFGASVFGSAQPTAKSRVSGNINLYYITLKSPSLSASNRSWMYTCNVNASHTFPKGFSAQFFGFFNSPRVQLQGRFGSFYNYNVAVKKELFEKKGSVSLGLDNPLTKAIRFKSTFDTPTFISTDVRNLYRRGVRLSFNYQFGKMNFTDKPRRKKRGSSDDTKHGDQGSGQ